MAQVHQFYWKESSSGTFWETTPCSAVGTRKINWANEQPYLFRHATLGPWLADSGRSIFIIEREVGSASLEVDFVLILTTSFVFLGLLAIPDLPSHRNGWFLEPRREAFGSFPVTAANQHREAYIQSY
jgi:hypothetical protein